MKSGAPTTGGHGADGKFARSDDGARKGIRGKRRRWLPPSAWAVGNKSAMVRAED